MAIQVTHGLHSWVGRPVHTSQGGYTLCKTTPCVTVVQEGGSIGTVVLKRISNKVVDINIGGTNIEGYMFSKESAHTGMKFFETVPRHEQLIKYITTRGREMLPLVAHTKRPKTLGIHDINTHLF
jgi:hypothetical protein